MILLLSESLPAINCALTVACTLSERLPQRFAGFTFFLLLISDKSIVHIASKFGRLSHDFLLTIRLVLFRELLHFPPLCIQLPLVLHPQLLFHFFSRLLLLLNHALVVLDHGLLLLFTVFDFAKFPRRILFDFKRLLLFGLEVFFLEECVFTDRINHSPCFGQLLLMQ